MQTTQSFSVNFIISKTKPDKTRADIFSSITIDGGLPQKMSLKEQINHCDWNNAKEMMSGKACNT